MLDRIGIVEECILIAGRNLVALMGAVLLSGCGGFGNGGPQTDPTASLAAPTREVSAKELEVALRDLSARAAEEPAEPYWPLMMAEWSTRAGDVEATKQHLRASLQLDPDYAPALSRLSKIHYEQGRHDEAIALLESSRARQGELPEALRVGLALHYQGAERFEDSDVLLNQVPDQPESLVAFRMLSSDDFLQAFEVTQAAVEQQADVAANQNNHGISLLYRGEPDEARDHFLQALKLEPDLAGAMYNLAIVEKFYFFDDDSSRHWFARYRELADADPDGLQELLASDPIPRAEGK